MTKPNKYVRPQASARAAVFAAVAVLASAVSAQANVRGSWAAPSRLQIDGTHAALLPNGEVVYFPHYESPSGRTTSAIVDPTNPAGVRYTTPRNYFCGAHSQLADGRQLFLGGDDNGGSSRLASAYDFRTGTWSDVASMQRPRWYPSALLLSDGTVWCFGGQTSPADPFTNDNTIEFYDPDANVWTLAGGQPIPGQWEEAYPRLHLMPDGRVFMPGHLPDTHLYDPVTRSWSTVGRTRLGRARGDGGSARLQDGRILIVGGHDNGTSFSSAEVIDLSNSNPRWTSVARMRSARAFIDTVVLPDGNVLVVGGDDAMGPRALVPELYDPSRNVWTDMASMSIRRSYHSTALLLPDARVVCASGDGNNGTGLYGESNDLEIWSPYYLFKTARPVIQSLPTEVGYGDQISMGYSSSVAASHVVIHRAGSSTHAFTYNQISVPVSFDSLTASTATFTLPHNPSVLPPGYYMVFLMSNDGVPSVARFLRIDGPSLAVDNLVAGRTARLTARKMGAGGLTVIGASAAGPGPVSLRLPCGRLAIDLDLPHLVIGWGTADSRGRFEASVPVPAGMLGATVWFDAIDLNSCVSSLRQGVVVR